MDDTEVNTNAEKSTNKRTESNVKSSTSHMKKAYSPTENHAISESSTESSPHQKAKSGRKKLLMSSQKNKVNLSASSSPIAKKTPPFEERYKRITTYLEKPLYEKVHNLYRQGEINKITNLVNTAVKEFVKKYYSH